MAVEFGTIVSLFVIFREKRFSGEQAHDPWLNLGRRAQKAEPMPSNRTASRASRLIQIFLDTFRGGASKIADANCRSSPLTIFATAAAASSRAECVINSFAGKWLYDAAASPTKRRFHVRKERATSERCDGAPGLIDGI